MKYRIRKTKEIVDVVGYSACTHTRYPEDYVCYIDNGGNEIIGRGLNIIWDFEPINEESVNDFDLQSFRAEAAKDILCHLLDRYTGDSDNKGFVTQAIGIADELIKQLKEDVIADKASAWLEKQGEKIDLANKEYWRGYREGKQETLDKYADFEKQGKQETLCDKCRKEQPSHSCQDITALGRCALEHQSKQKPADKTEPKFKVGDWVVSKFGKSWHINSFDKKNYQVSEVLSDGKRNYNWFPISKQDEMHLWTIQDAKDGDVLVFDDIIMIFKNIKTVCAANTYILYCDKIVVDDWCDFGDNAQPATKEQRDLLFQKMNEAGYEWDAEKKELKKIEQTNWSEEDGVNSAESKSTYYHKDSLYYAIDILEKTLGKVEGYQSDDGILEHKCAISAVRQLAEPKSIWSEEDEYQINTILHGLDLKRELYKKEGNKVEEKRYSTQYDWLKSLRPNHWKSNEKHMNSAEYNTAAVNDDVVTAYTDENGKKWVHICAGKFDFLLDIKNLSDNATYVIANKRCKDNGMELPSKSMWELIQAFRTEVDKVIKDLGGEPLENYLWACDEYCDSSAWRFYATIGYLGGSNKMRTYGVRGSKKLQVK